MRRAVGLVAVWTLCIPVGWAAARSDSDLHLAAAAELRSLPQFTVFDLVSLTVRDGHVTLTGKVTAEGKRRAAVQAVTAVPGVRAVDCQILVLPPSRSDDDLRERVARAVYGNPAFWHYAALPNPTIHIIVEEGHVTLAGVVRDERDRAMARALAMQSGARSVTSLLRAGSEGVE